jgi:hypothetical protein
LADLILRFHTFIQYGGLSDGTIHMLYTIDLNYIAIVKIMKSTSILAVWLSSIILLLMLVAITVPLAHAQTTLNITRADADKPYGGEKLGTVLIVPKEHVLSVMANMSAQPTNGTVYEGWLVDDGGSNPYTYTQFIVTEEPFEDPDPRAATATGGTQLLAPFGR